MAIFGANRGVYFFSAAVFLSFALFGSSVHAQSDARVDRIRSLYRLVSDQIGEFEKAPDASTIYVTEVVVNKHNASYPAVGIYNSVIRFYYTYGDREKDPYPNRLLKIMVTTRRSAKTGSSEFLFSEKGDLIFAFIKEGDVEKRAYFDAGRLIKLLDNEKTVLLKSNEANSAAAELLSRSKRLRAVFTNSL